MEEPMESICICPLPTIFLYEWKTEAKMLVHLYLSKAAQEWLLKAVRVEQNNPNTTVVFAHPLLQSPISLHPDVDMDYIHNLIEYELLPIMLVHTPGKTCLRYHFFHPPLFTHCAMSGFRA